MMAMKAALVGLLVACALFTTAPALAADSGVGDGGCISNAQCTATPTTPICDTGSCRACKVVDGGSNECAGLSKVCAASGAQAGQCVDCVTSGSCSGQTPYCETTTNTCV